MRSCAEPNGLCQELISHVHYLVLCLHRAASVVQHLLMGNPDAKLRLLHIPLGMPNAPSAPAELLLPR